MINMLKAFVSLHCSRLVALPQDVRVPSVLPRLNACDRTGGRLRSMGGWLPMASRANGCGSPLHVVLCEAAGLHVGPSPEAIASVLATGWVDRGGSVFEAARLHVWRCRVAPRDVAVPQFARHEVSEAWMPPPVCATRGQRGLDACRHSSCECLHALCRSSVLSTGWVDRNDVSVASLLA